MTNHEELALILENQKSLMKEIGFVEELLKALLVNNSLDYAENVIKNSSEEYHKSMIGKQVTIADSCNHYFDGLSKRKELGGFANHRNRTWTIKDYRMGKYKLYWTNGSHTFQLWFDTNDVVFLYKV